MLLYSHMCQNGNIIIFLIFTTFEMLSFIIAKLNWSAVVCKFETTGNKLIISRAMILSLSHILPL